VLWTRDFPVPLDDLGVVSTAVSVHLQDAFPGRRSRDDVGHSSGSPEAYRRYLALKHSFAVRADGVDVEALLVDLQTLQGQAPQLAEVPILASAIHRLRYVEGRQTADADAAVAQARRAVELNPGSVLAQRALLAALVDIGRLDDARAALEALKQLAPGDPRTGMWEANLLLAQGNGEKALELASIAAERLPAWDVLLQLADFHYRSGDLNSARDGLGRVLELFPGHYDSLSRLAQIELVSGDLDRAVGLYRTLVERSPGVAELTNLGVALMFAGDYQASCEWLERALQGAPTNPDVLLNAADCRALTGEQDHARDLYARVLVEAEKSADEASGLLARAQAYAHLENHASAIGAISEALRRFPDRADVAYVAALVYSVLGEVSSAHFHATRSLDLGLERRWFDLPWFEPIRGSLRQEGAEPTS
jgi:serine/threonine-protein kinase